MPEHSHAAADGFQQNCAYCGGEISGVAWNDPRMSCDNCGEIQPCCKPSEVVVAGRTYAVDQFDGWSEGLGAWVYETTPGKFMTIPKES